jgi:hypothetical protein
MDFKLKIFARSLNPTCFHWSDDPIGAGLHVLLELGIPSVAPLSAARIESSKSFTRVWLRNTAYLELPLQSFCEPAGLRSGWKNWATNTW